MTKNRKQQTAEEYLSNSDPVLAGIISRVELSNFKPEKDYFRALVESIISQQLSGKAADTIIKRFRNLFPSKNFPGPKQVLRVREARMRAVGMSFQKATYVRNLAEAVEKKKLYFKQFNKMSDEEIISQLVQVKGIGQWTAEMFLMFAMGREDVFSFGALGLKNAIQKAYRLKKHPEHKKALQLSERWRPYRTYACRYLWASLDSKKKTL